MIGEFSRLLFDRSTNYTGVLMQQGRALVDAEWNEQAALLNEQLRRAVSDLLNTLPAPSLQLTVSGVKKSRDPDNALCFECNVPAGVFYVDGVRCLQSSAATAQIPIHPGDRPLHPGKPYVLSVHAWERFVTALEEPLLRDTALEGADSALRSMVAWELQVDKGTAGTSYQEWISKQRGAIQVRTTGCADSSPSLYRIEITKDGVAATERGPKGAAAEFAWSRENPPLHPLGADDRKPPRLRSLSAAAAEHDWIELLNAHQLALSKPGKFLRVTDEILRELRAKRQSVASGTHDTSPYLRLWDGHQTVIAEEDNQFVTLDECVQIRFGRDRKYRRGECWLVPYRGSHIDENWQLPSGQHYFAEVSNSSPEPVPTRSIDTQQALDRQQILGHLVEQIVGLGSQTPWSIPAGILASQTDSTWLKRWLGTALLSELLTAEFEAFWQRLTLQLPGGMDADKELHREARNVWRTARELEFALRDS